MLPCVYLIKGENDLNVRAERRMEAANVDGCAKVSGESSIWGIVVDEERDLG